jgi:hypothetical protein
MEDQKGSRKQDTMAREKIEQLPEVADFERHKCRTCKEFCMCDGKLFPALPFQRYSKQLQEYQNRYKVGKVIKHSSVCICRNSK